MLKIVATGIIEAVDYALHVRVVCAVHSRLRSYHANQPSRTIGEAATQSSSSQDLDSPVPGQVLGRRASEQWLMAVYPVKLKLVLRCICVNICTGSKHRPASRADARSSTGGGDTGGASRAGRTPESRALSSAARSAASASPCSHARHPKL